MEGEFDREKEWFDLDGVLGSTAPLGEQLNTAVRMYGLGIVGDAANKRPKKEEVRKWSEDSVKGEFFPPLWQYKDMYDLMQQAESVLLQKR